MSKLSSISDKTALITGAARGIGAAIARDLARAGVTIALQDIDLAASQAAVDQIKSEGGKAYAFGGDITDLQTPAALFKSVSDTIGPPDILINNAAVQEHVSWLEVSPARLEWQWRGNVLAPWELTRLCFPAMKAAQWGRILNVSSIQGKRGYGGMLGYSVTKAALDNFTRTVASEVTKHGITVNAIAPGYFDTYRNRSQFPDAETKKKRGEWLPAGRVGEPEDTVGAALLLCSDAGAYITGQILYIDGGMDLIR